MTRDQLIRMGFEIVPHPSLTDIVKNRPDDLVLNRVVGYSTLSREKIVPTNKVLKNPSNNKGSTS